MNNIVRRISDDPFVGFDQFDQLYAEAPCPYDPSVMIGRVVRNLVGKKCCVCGREWEATAASLLDQTVFAFKADMFMHVECELGVRRVTQWNTIRDSMIDAGFLFDMSPSPSQYQGSPEWVKLDILANDEARTPSRDYLIIGHRKRVWEVQFYSEDDKLLSALNSLYSTHQYQGNIPTHGISQTDAETKRFYFHAWTNQELVDCLSRILWGIGIWEYGSEDILRRRVRGTSTTT